MHKRRVPGATAAVDSICRQRASARSRSPAVAKNSSGEHIHAMPVCDTMVPRSMEAVMDNHFDAFIDAAVERAKSEQSLLWADEVAERIVSSTPLTVRASDISEKISRAAARAGVAVTVTRRETKTKTRTSRCGCRA
jgi:hypothetical protein